MKGDTVVLLDMDQTETEEVTVTREASTDSVFWKRTGALLAITMCFAAAIFFTFHYKEHHHAAESDDLRHTLRQISASGSVRDAIHLHGKYNEKLPDSLVWKQGEDQSHAKGLSLDHNEIVVPTSGLYFVYSQASFHVSCHLDDKDNTAGTVSYMVKLWTPSYGNPGADRHYDTILRSVRTTCEKKASSDPEADDKWYSSVYMGAVFHLHKGDRLKTAMEKKYLPTGFVLDDHSANTFFGVFAL